MNIKSSSYHLIFLNVGAYLVNLRNTKTTKLEGHPETFCAIDLKNLP